MDSRIRDLVEQYRVTKGQPLTHVSEIRPKGRFFISGEILNELYDLQGEVVLNNGISGMSESTGDSCPVIADFDFRYDIDGELRRHHTQQMIDEVIAAYISTFFDVFEVIDERDLICAVTERERPYRDANKIKDGFHIQFPFIIAHRDVQKYVIRPRVAKKILERKVFDNLPLENPNLDQIYDRNVPPDFWRMYGSRKAVSVGPYKLTRIVDDELNELTIRKAFYGRYDETFTREPEFYLPLFLSVIDKGEPLELKDGIRVDIQQRVKKAPISSDKSEDQIIKDLAIAKELLPLLSADRAKEYAEWMNVGWCLFNIAAGSEEGLQLWIQFSKQSEKFRQGICEAAWDSMRITDMSLGSLRYWAMQDNLTGYMEMKRQKGLQLSRNGNCTHYSIANVLYHFYNDTFVCCHGNGKLWYEFRNHRWIQVEETIILTKITTIRQHFLNIVSELYAKMANPQLDAAQRASLKTQVADLNKIVLKLEDNGFKNNVAKEARQLFYDPEFQKRLNTNPDLMGFPNGVLDLLTDEFREGRPDDYISMTCGVPFVVYEDEDEETLNVHKYLSQVFPDRKVRRHFVRDVSSMLRGGNINKRIRFWSGEQGNNSKSVIVKLIKMCWGDYFINASTSLLTGKRAQAGSALPELARRPTARIIVFQEPAEDEKVNNGIMKEITGGDTMYVRTLYSEGSDVTPMFKPIFVCNRISRLATDDPASWKRIRVTPFEAEFVDDAPETEEEQYAQMKFPVDYDFEKNLPDMASPFMWILVKEYKQYRSSGYKLYEPSKVKLATTEYYRQSNFYKEFMDETIVSDEDSSVSLTEIFERFKEWFKFTMPGTKMPDRGAVRHALLTKWGKPTKGNKWEGYKLKDD